MKRYLFDFHTQTLEHGLNKPLLVEETIYAAIDMGLSAICLTDHYPLPPGFTDPTEEKDCAMPMSWYADYQQEITKAIDKYKGQIEIYRGAEFDWLPEYEDWIKSQVGKWQFDYVIGSVHFVGQISDQKGKRNFIVDYEENEFLKGIASYGGIKPLIFAYYKLVRQMVKSGLFDGVGHIDLIKKYNDGSLFSEKAEWYRQAIFETLGVIADSDMTMEVNTSGWDKKCKSAYPSPWIVNEAFRQNIGLTIGSDGHVPEAIGRNLDKAVLLAKKAGYKKLLKYKKRKRVAAVI